MNKNRILGIVLAVQVVAALIYVFSGSKLQSHSGIAKLLEVDPGNISRIAIEDGEGSISELYLAGDTWLTSEDFPINGDRIDSLLEDISELDHGLPVATTAAAATRFKVADDEFERHVKLYNGSNLLGEFYLGSGAGARRNHIRLAGDASIYVAGLATYAVPANIGDWQDKEQLQIEKDDVTAIKLDGKMTILRSQEEAAGAGVTDENPFPGWTTEGLADDESLDIEAIEQQLGNLADLRYNLAFKGSLDEATSGADSPVREIELSYGDKGRTYRFFKAKEGDDYILAVSDREELFEISQYTGNRIIENLNPGSLIQKPEPEQDEDSAIDDSPQFPATTNGTENNMPWLPGN